MDNEQTRQKLLRKLRPDGILNSDEQVLSMLDRNLTGDSLVIPAGRKGWRLKLLRAQRRRSSSVFYQNM